MVEGKVKKRLILSQDDPEAVLELPDGHCNLHLRHEVTTTKTTYEVNRRLEKDTPTLKNAQQWEHPRTTVRKILTNRLSEEELRTLCFDLRLEYDNFPGQGKAGKVREIVAYFLRKGGEHISELVSYLKREHNYIYKCLPPEVLQMVQVSSHAPQSPFLQRSTGNYRAKID
jgi:hypothetical protein